MKRVIIAIIMLTVAISVSSISAYILNKKTETLINMMNRITIEDGIEELITEWNSTKKFLKFVVAHNTVNELDESFIKLKRNKNDKKEFEEISSEIRIQLNILKKSEKAAAENVF